jgi:DNA-binding IscR family transcriptional regulator
VCKLRAEERLSLGRIAKRLGVTDRYVRRIVSQLRPVQPD